MNSFIWKLFFCFVLLFAFKQQLQAQRCTLNTVAAEPILLKGKKAFHMNSFDMHLVMYVTKLGQEDSLCHAYTDSLRFLNDTVLVRLCGLREVGCSDTLVPANELSSVINNSYWQKIPVNRITKIKSKRQPLSRITFVTVIASYAVFVSSAAVSVFSKNSDVTYSAAVVAGVSNTIFFAAWGTNAFIAKKRFKFNKIKTYNSYKVMI